MDICEADGRYWLLELNPFSGAVALFALSDEAGRRPVPGAGGVAR